MSMTERCTHRIRQSNVWALRVLFRYWDAEHRYPAIDLLVIEETGEVHGEVF